MHRGMVVDKHLVTRLFVGSLVAIAGGLVLLGVTGGLAWANGAFVMDGPDVVGVRSTPGGWLLITLAALGALILIGAAIVQFVAWIGAVINASQLPDKTWFVVLLVTGLLSFGLIGMIIYLIAAPDSQRPAPPRRQPTQFPGATAA
jgi:hypothetical protein